MCIYLFSLSECQNPASLTEANRKETFTGVLLCDNSLGPNWFRFQGAAGNKMAATCVPINRCGTHATGWLNGVHPTVSEGIVTRQVCFNWSGGCCVWSINIQVRNCNGYFMYYISGTPQWIPVIYATVVLTRLSMKTIPSTFFLWTPQIFDWFRPQGLFFLAVK